MSDRDTYTVREVAEAIDASLAPWKAKVADMRSELTRVKAQRDVLVAFLHQAREGVTYKQMQGVVRDVLKEDK